jgi:NitT/TauT family transport system substrate-binding protein
VTTHLIVATEFLEAHPDVVKRLIEGHVAAIDFTNENPEAAQEVVIAAIEELSGSQLSPDTVATAWENLEFTVDPIAASLADLGAACHRAWTARQRRSSTASMT